MASEAAGDAREHPQQEGREELEEEGAVPGAEIEEEIEEGDEDDMEEFVVDEEAEAREIANEDDYNRKKMAKERLQDENTRRGAAREGLMKAIRSKPSWEDKLRDETIVTRYKFEAIDQGIALEIVEETIRDLQEEANYIQGKDIVSTATPSSASTTKINLVTSPMKAFKAIPRTEWEDMLNSVADLQPKIIDMMEEYLEEKDLGVWHVDNLVLPNLRNILVTRLDAIADLPNKDFHPKSKNQVQDLIHPSLFPYIENVSPILDKSALPSKSYVSQWTRQYEDSKYQWLPSQFYVEPSGTVQVRSYINNLEKAPNEDLYKAIELVFGIFLPMFEKVLSPKNLRGRELQVIVKAANYVIQPKESAYEGQWHVEGMSHEHIVASGIYYYSTSPWLKDGGLEFRRPRNEETDFPEMMKYQWHNFFESDEMYEKLRHLDLENNIHLGAVPTVEGRLLVFTNELQHKVSSIINDSPDQVGTRKILVFFLVDPDIEIVSTKHIPEQQWDRKVPDLMAVMSKVAFKISGKRFSPEIVYEIVSRACFGLTMLEARRHRLLLMEERAIKVVQDNMEWEREYSLCEH